LCIEFKTNNKYGNKNDQSSKLGLEVIVFLAELCSERKKKNVKSDKWKKGTKTEKDKYDEKG
jgi:hypothetical protein